MSVMREKNALNRFARPLPRHRQRAEQRFRWYGRAALLLALSALLVLLGSLVPRGWQGLFYTEIALEFTAQEAPENATQEALARLLAAAATRRLPGPDDARATRLARSQMLSVGAVFALKDALARHPARAFQLWLPASDKVDQARKHASMRARLSALQQRWLVSLQQRSQLRAAWNPYFFTRGDAREPELAGMLGSIIGSLFTLLSCMFVAFPIGVMAAIYLEEFARKNRLTEGIEITINNLAAVPSIVFGLLGLDVYLGLFGLPRSASFVGGITLMLLILPTIIITTRASLRAIPLTIRDAARGLGASPVQVVLHHTLPLALPGIMTGLILGLARAMGETAPLLMIGMVAFIAALPHSPLDPATVMPVQIYLWTTSSEPGFAEKTSAAIAVLLVILSVFNGVAVLLRKKYERKW